MEECQGQRESAKVGERGTKKYGERAKLRVVEMAKKNLIMGSSGFWLMEQLLF